MPPKSGLAAKVASRLAASNNSGPSTGRKAPTKPPVSKPAQPTPAVHPPPLGPTADLPTFRDEPPQLDVPLVDEQAAHEPGPEQLAAASEQSPPGRLERQYSIASQKTVGLLDQIKFDLLDLQQRLSRAEAEIEAPPPTDGLPAALRGELAKLHGDANKLLATRIDAILTGDLTSGKDDARAMRKEMIRTVEGLIETVEDLVKRFDALAAERGIAYSPGKGGGAYSA
eukprot:jgi/Chrpa1/23238/Chrysochromulina_OHIO_Genome00007828-RA